MLTTQDAAVLAAAIIFNLYCATAGILVLNVIGAAIWLIIFLGLLGGSFKK